MVLLDHDPLDLICAHDDALDLIAALCQRPAWQLDGLCIEYPGVTFFPNRGEATEPARDVC